MDDQLVTPLKKAKNLGSAHHGLSHWVQQRFTAVALVFLSLWAMFAIAYSFRLDYPVFIDFWTQGHNVVLLSMTVMISLYHAQLGIAIVIGDYINHKLLGMFVLILVKFFAMVLAAAFFWQMVTLVAAH